MDNTEAQAAEEKDNTPSTIECELENISDEEQDNAKNIRKDSDVNITAFSVIILLYFNLVSLLNNGC